MGFDKALIEFGGATLLGRVIAAVERVADDVTIVGDRAAYDRFRVPVVADAYPGAGALGGIATGIRSARREWVLVVACDMPFLSVTLLKAMAGEPRDADVLIPVTPIHRSDGGDISRIEPLHAIYARHCMDRFERAIKAGRLTVADAIGELHVHELRDDWLRGYDPELRSFMNVNTPQELVAARALLEDEARIVEGTG